MSSLRVEVVNIDNISAHPNADRLEIAAVKGWNCVVPKGEFHEGQRAVYFPIDSILPEALEAKLFGPDSKIKLHHHRIKTIKLRGAISQGLLVPLIDLGLQEVYPTGYDLTAQLGVTKYEPPETGSPQSNCNQVSRKQTNPNFHKYTDIENYKNYPGLFVPGELVWILEKIHGTNFRAGWVKSHPTTWWKRLRKWFGLLPEYEFVYGSHNVQLQDRWTNNTWHKQTTGGKNIYWEAVERYDLKRVLGPGDVVYGEVYGDGVQKGYLYDCKPGERKLAVFDWQFNGKYIDHIRVIQFCETTGLVSVPVDDLIEFNQYDIEDYVNNADSQLKPGLRREGVVIKSAQEETCYIGRKVLKWKNDTFLLKEVDDTH